MNDSPAQSVELNNDECFAALDAATNPPTISSDNLEDAREWLLDCFDDEYDQELIASLDAAGLHRGISRHYEGGIEEFNLSCE